MIVTAFLLLICLLFPSDDKYVIHGSFNKPQQEEWIYLLRFMDPAPRPDSVQIIDGKFRFEGTIDIPELYALSYHFTRTKGILPLFLEPGEFTVVIDPANWDGDPEISGGKLNGEYYYLKKNLDENFTKKIVALYEEEASTTKEAEDEVERQMKALVNESIAFRINYIKEHFDSPVAVFILSQIYPQLSADELGALLPRFAPEVKQTIIHRMLTEYHKNMNASNDATVAALDFDDRIREFSADFSAESIVQTLNAQNPGKALYIDLWAPWCGPCFKKFPYSRELRKNTDHEKIAFIYLCVDTKTKIDPDNWKKVIEKEQLKGRHYMMGGALLEKLAKETGYEIRGIPHYILIDKDGNIISNNAPPPDSPEIKKLLKDQED